MRKRLQSLLLRSLLGGGVLAVLIVAACASSGPPQTPQQTPPPPQKVKVVLNPGAVMAPSGAYRVGVNPYRVHVQPGDTVEFMIVPPNQVSVHQLTFVDVSPAERAQQVFSGEGGTFLVVIREDAPLDLYKYSIAFVIGTRIFFRDPEIEVGDPDN